MRSFHTWLILTLIALTPASASEKYRIDARRSSIGFGIHQFLGLTKGKFTQFSGTIEIDRGHPELSTVAVTIAVKSIDTGIKKRDEHLRSHELFDAEKYPQITFRSRSVTRTGPQNGDILGDLTMHGISKPVTLHVQLITADGAHELGNRTRWRVTTEPIRRRNFGLLFSSTAETISGIAQNVTPEIIIEAYRSE